MMRTFLLMDATAGRIALRASWPGLPHHLLYSESYMLVNFETFCNTVNAKAFLKMIGEQRDSYQRPASYSKFRRRVPLEHLR
jgi:hypothetical protein